PHDCQEPRMPHPRSLRTKPVFAFLLAIAVGGAGAGAIGAGVQLGPTAVGRGALAGLVGALASGLLAGLVSREPATIFIAGITGGVAGQSGSPLRALVAGSVGGITCGLFLRALLAVRAWRTKQHRPDVKD